MFISPWRRGGPAPRQAPQARRRLALQCVTLAGLAAAALALGGAPAPGPAPEPLLPKSQRGGIHCAVTTHSRQAQDYFDPGLMFCYGFDHEEAIRAFQAALRADSTCAMAYWGIAWASGPNINIPFMDDNQSQLAAANVARAATYAAGAKPVEAALVAALTTRYAWPAPADRRPLDVAFANAMRQVYEQFPADPTVAAVFAEALMDLRPWDLWSATGQPRPETPEIVAVLKKLRAAHPDHAGAMHLYIHTMEASPAPERALAAANALRGRVPGSGHLIHMPSHIDIRLGRYKEAIAANLRGIGIDRERVRRAGPGVPYAVYRAHNFHFIAYAAMFDGQHALAMQAARDLRAEVPIDIVRMIPDFLDAFWAMPYHVEARFGAWDDILAEPPPAADLHVTTAFWHYARGLAFAARGEVPQAVAERDSFAQALARVPASASAGNNTARTVLGIGRSMLEGEVEYRRGNYDAAFAALRTAVAADDSLRYDEPWGWPQPVRHALGALLLEQGRVAEAEAVYRTDLERHPGNGWALHGLSECLRRAGRSAEAKQVAARFAAAWTRSDTPIQASCFCRRKV